MTAAAAPARVNVRAASSLDALTGARFFAAFHVVLYHSFRQFTAPGSPLETLFLTGNVAVCFFFVLSGFILTYTYGNRSFTKREFWTARFARIYPAYGLALVLFALPTAYLVFRGYQDLSWKQFWIDFGASATLLQGWFPSIAQCLNYPAWSLSVEALFYLIFPFVVARIVGFSNQKALAGLILLWLASLSAPVLYVWLNPDHTRTWITVGNHGSYNWLKGWYAVVSFYPLVRVPEFLFGCVLGALYLRGLRLPAWMGYVTSIVPLVVLSFTRDVPVNFAIIGLMPLFGIFILSTAGMHSGPLYSLLSNKPMRILGEASYGIYILQAPVAVWMELAFAKFRLDALTQTFAFRCCYAACLIAFCVASMYWFEMPVRSWIRRRLGR